jgi:hypothetical protein
MVEDESPQTRLLPPPRSIPLSLTARVLFGGVLSQFGWAFFAFGMVFIWAFDAGAGAVESLRFRGDVATVQGVVTESRSTNLSINDRPVYETSYSATLADGRILTGASYATGRWEEAGTAVVIEWIDGDRPLSRISGYRASQAGLGVLFVLIFPLAGFGMAVFGLRKGLIAHRLMSTGQLARGTLLTSEATSTRINEMPVMKLTFEFEVDGAPHHAVAKTHVPHDLEDEERELLVYDPRNPENAAMLDELRCRPRVNARGEFEATRSTLPATLYLLLPGVSILTMLRYIGSLL